MAFHRRNFLRLTASTAAAALPFLSRSAFAQTYPNRPVRIVAGYAPGGGADIIARLIGQALSERLGQSFVVENRPGASTNIAAEAVVRAAPDGYSLLLVDGAAAINATLYDNLNFRFIRDIAPVAGISRAPNVVVVQPSFPARTVPEFIAHAKANPGKLNTASGGMGDPPHVSGELFKMMAGVDMVHVPYRGLAPALTDLIGGRVQVIFATMASAIEHVRAGTLRALAVTTTTRSELLPDVPSLSEFLPGYEASQWYGIGAPRNTSAEIVEKLNREINAVLGDARIKMRLADLGGTLLAGTPTDFERHIAQETEKWAKVVRFSGAKPG
jgi:tripartite-type tricarboxylate transporter receptor subunit TctC